MENAQDANVNVPNNRAKNNVFAGLWQDVRMVLYWRSKQYPFKPHL